MKTKMIILIIMMLIISGCSSKDNVLDENNMFENGVVDENLGNTESGINLDINTGSGSAILIESGLLLDLSDLELGDEVFGNDSLFDFYSRDDLAIIEMLASGESKELLSYVDGNKYYVFSYLFDGKNEGKLNSDEKALVKCIKDAYDGNMSNNYNIKDEFYRGICFGEDRIFGEDNLLNLKNSLINTLIAKEQKSDSYCKGLPSSDNTQLNYFLCLAVVNKDFPKIKALMKAYIYVDFQKKDECDYFKDVNSYLFDSCKQQYRIWE